jgi:hypothetical protein
MVQGSIFNIFVTELICYTYNMERSVARQLGLKHYSTGRPCKRGHIADRLVSKATCCACKSIDNKNWAKENPEKQKESSRKHIKNNPEYDKVRWRRRIQENPGKEKARTAVRRAKRLGRYVIWSDKSRIQSVYDECEYMNSVSDQQYQVDHIIPLCGIDITGLHVHNNLQILTKEQNIAKSNKYAIIIG